MLRLEERRRLARFDDESMAAAAHRLRAARFVASLSREQIAESGIIAPELAHIEAAEAGLVLPDYALETFYWRRLKLTRDFFDRGEVKDVPVEIEDMLFAALKAQLAGK